ncbi:hypothetical protein A5664_11660 [Mycolicibacterium fortuitum]|uniref:TetR/AcrR family transcriptional regulator n=1 Tax=Mycolicibacterium fortuitum TaxID=1766 RepID=UPI0007EDDA7D|nr:TetR/AcrR family transcriptional regulator [Mycolicibacterium fortuitum]OBI68094.1 hypothetical protein A5664_11660 [Mycolicibacterium fortuitum]
MIASLDPTLDAGSTRELILRSARCVFLSRGYAAASMDQIAAESGVARTTLYNQFGSKKTLFDATMTQMWDRMPITAVIASTEAASSPEEALYSIGHTIVEFWAPREAVAFLRLVMWESSTFPELGQSFCDNGRDPARSAVTAYVRRLSNEPGYCINDVDLATAQFIDVILGEVVYGRLFALSAGSLDESRCHYLVSEAVALFLARYRLQA